MLPGLRHWFQFLVLIHGADAAESRALPPRTEDILAWSSTFRCVGTFANYLGYLKTACQAIWPDAPPIAREAIKKAMISIIKRGQFTARPKFFIDRVMVSNMLKAVQKDLEDVRFGALWLFAYAFLLRVPSEAGTCFALPLHNRVFGFLRHCRPVWRIHPRRAPIQSRHSSGAKATASPCDSSEGRIARTGVAS